MGEENNITENAVNISKRKRDRYDITKYLIIAAITVGAFFVCILLFFMVYRYSQFTKFWNKIMTIMQPFIIGAALAYIVNPVMMFVERHIIKFLSSRVKNPKTVKKAARGIGIFCSLALVVLIIVFLLELIIPQIVESIQGVIKNFPDEIDSFMAWVNTITQGNTQLSEMLEKGIVTATQFLQTWVEEHMLPQVNTYLLSITNGVVSMAKLVINLFVGVIISVYLLSSKERFIGQTKKLIYTVFNAKKGNVIIHTARKSNRIFGGFISGKIIDSLIIGLLCYMGLIILNMPYPILVSVIVGVTNVIPFFGPYIGAVPSIIIIALDNPIKGLYFAIFILVLQQLDGNVIGPKILGDSTGLSPFWVVFAIILGGGLFGFAGMLLGVPTFAVIYYIMGEIVSTHLTRKKLPTDTESYIRAEKLEEESNEIKYL